MHKMDHPKSCNSRTKNHESHILKLHIYVPKILECTFSLKSRITYQLKFWNGRFLVDFIRICVHKIEKSRRFREDIAFECGGS